MLRAIVLTTLIVAFSSPAHGRQDRCADFQKAVRATYNFKPSRLSDAERDAKSAAMDRFWKETEAKRDESLPCLRAALADPKADPWFRFDGSNLLVSLDSSQASKAEQVRQYTAVDLDDVNLQVWVQTLARRGAEGFDVSEAGARWLAYPKAKYYLPQHAAFEVNTLTGALFIFGSMDEAQATPALIKIVNQADHPGRLFALLVLLEQATPESLRALRQIAASESGFPEKVTVGLREALERPRLFTPRDKPKTSREEFLKAFNGIVNGQQEYFFELVGQVPDGEKDVVAVMKAEDLPLVRKVRRRMIASASPHAVGYYDSFTRILMTLIRKPESTK